MWCEESYEKGNGGITLRFRISALKLQNKELGIVINNNKEKEARMFPGLIEMLIEFVQRTFAFSVP